MSEAPKTRKQNNWKKDKCRGLSTKLRGLDSPSVTSKGPVFQIKPAKLSVSRYAFDRVNPTSGCRSGDSNQIGRRSIQVKFSGPIVS